MDVEQPTMLQVPDSALKDLLEVEAALISGPQTTATWAAVEAIRRFRAKITVVPDTSATALLGTYSSPSDWNDAR